MHDDRHLAVRFTEGPFARWDRLGFSGPGTASIENGALVLAGPRLRVRRSYRVALAVLALGAAVLVVDWLLNYGDARYGEGWRLVFVLVTGASLLWIKFLPAIEARPERLRLAWEEIRGAFPVGWSMRLVTTRGQVELTGAGPEGARELERLGHLIVARARGPAYARPRGLARHRVLLALAVPVAVGVGLIAFTTTHPKLFVDHVGPQALDLWIDGARAATLPPTSPGGVPWSTRLRSGAHTLGTSPAGAPGPVTVHAVAFDADALFNPDGTVCYEREVGIYGELRPDDQVPEGGRLAPAAFYADLRPTNWFRSLPAEGPKQRDGRAAIRTAILRDPGCAGLEPASTAPLLGPLRTQD